MFENAPSLLRPGSLSDADAGTVLAAVGFADEAMARRRLELLCGLGPEAEASREALADCLPTLLAALSDAATPDGSLLNFERYAQSVADRTALFRYLRDNPRAVEILVRLFVGSQFLTEILLKNPDSLDRLTRHKRLAEFKHREQFELEALGAAAGAGGPAAQFDALRKYQKWELLRIGACDGFGLLDLKSVTVQLSLLADSLVRACLALLRERLGVPPAGFCVLALGKLGGEELNYSSDIDLIFLAEGDAPRFWELGQKLIKALLEATGEGFLYRVDMRLRPWGKSGALVNTPEAHLAYLAKHGQAWERQALLKARPIAGDEAVGQDFLRRAEPLIFARSPAEVRAAVRATKTRIEEDLGRRGRAWGNVKGGPGSIRDVEFVTQCLQLIHGGRDRGLRSFNTLDGLNRLADAGHLRADEYRQLAGGYNFLRTVEHSLQLMHHKQVHSLPTDERELAYLARRLDYPDGGGFVAQYERTVTTVRAVYEKYVGEPEGAANDTGAEEVTAGAGHLARMEPGYHDTFTADEFADHAALLARIDGERVVAIAAVPLPDGQWRLTVAGRDHVGDLSMICGLLFVYGFDIEDGNVFTRLLREGEPGRTVGGRGGDFVNVFTVRPTSPVDAGVWPRYECDLRELIRVVHEGRQREAQGRLAKRVAAALRATAPRSADRTTGTPDALLPVAVEIDNAASDRFTVLHIRAEDTPGFLYELSNALALTGYDLTRVIISTVGSRVFDTLYVTDAAGGKITGANAQRELRTAVVLIKHFTHLLPASSNPESALLHFRDLLGQVFRQPDWGESVARLERPEVLDGLARVLGLSDFLWEDFLRLQYANLFPVVTDLARLAERKSHGRLDTELAEEMAAETGFTGRRRRLNAFKDREMFRVDMRHLLGRVAEFGDFSDELTDVAEAAVAGACDLCRAELEPRYGVPRDAAGNLVPLAVLALGKCGGRELGYASDIELMFVHGGPAAGGAGDRTDGPEPITPGEFFRRLVELFAGTIEARQEGIFQIDLRLRPYGRAGGLAVPVGTLAGYFGPNGPAWPYERQALVKLRPIAGDPVFGAHLVRLRDRLLYTGEPFDAVAMRAMRERQVRRLVKPGTFHAKLSPGGLVDTEYLVQGLQITHGHDNPTLRATNTLAALTALNAAELLGTEHDRLRAAYVFQRRLIDALRMVRGHAKDLTVPPPDGEEFEFLARRLGDVGDAAGLTAQIERHTATVLDVTRRLIGGE